MLRFVLILSVLVCFVSSAIIKPATLEARFRPILQNTKLPELNLTRNVELDMSRTGSLAVLQTQPIVLPTKFESYDINKDDYIDLEELANVSYTNLLEASRAFNAGDLNRDGLVSQDEFITFPWTLLTDPDEALNDTMDSTGDVGDYGEAEDENDDENEDGGDGDVDNHIVDEGDDDRFTDDVINNDYDVMEDRTDGITGETV